MLASHSHGPGQNQLLAALPANEMADAGATQDPASATRGPLPLYGWAATRQGTLQCSQLPTLSLVAPRATAKQNQEIVFHENNR